MTIIDIAALIVMLPAALIWVCCVYFIHKYFKEENNKENHG